MPCSCSSQTDSTGTTVLDRKYEEIMAKPTASDNGTNSDRTGSAMMNAGNEDRQNAHHGQQTRHGRFVAAAITAGASDGVFAIWT